MTSSMWLCLVLLGSTYIYLTFAGCDDDEFQCDDGQCIDADDRCDDGFDCTDYSDEKNCLVIKPCPENLHKCSDGECEKAEVCNGVVECPDGSDEYNCGNQTSDSLTLSTLNSQFPSDSSVITFVSYSDINPAFTSSVLNSSESSAISTAESELSTSFNFMSLGYNSLSHVTGDQSLTSDTEIITSSQVDLRTFGSSIRISSNITPQLSVISVSTPLVIFKDTPTYSSGIKYTSFIENTRSVIQSTELFKDRKPSSLKSAYFSDTFSFTYSSLYEYIHQSYAVTSHDQFGTSSDIVISSTSTLYGVSFKYSTDFKRTHLSFTTPQSLFDTTSMGIYTSHLKQKTATITAISSSLKLSDSDLSYNDIFPTSVSYSSINSQLEFALTVQSISVNFSNTYSNYDEDLSDISLVPHSRSIHLPDLALSSMLSISQTRSIYDGSIFSTTPIATKKPMKETDKTDKTFLIVIIIVIIVVLLLCVIGFFIVYRHFIRKRERKEELGRALSMDMIHPDLTNDKTTRKPMVKTASFAKIHHDCNW